jgi:hypothetical protein
MQQSELTNQLHGNQCIGLIGEIHVMKPFPLALRAL